MINEESKKQLEARKALNQQPLNTLSPIDARKQFNEAKENVGFLNIEILNVEKNNDMNTWENVILDYIIPIN